MKRTSPKAKAGRGLNFSDNELEYFLNLVDAKKPVDSHKWQEIANQHETKWKNQRSLVSLKRKINTLCNRKPPTGNPQMCGRIARTKEIMKNIGMRADAGEEIEEDLDIPLGNIGHGNSGSAPALENRIPMGATINMQQQPNRPLVIPRAEKKKKKLSISSPLLKISSK